MKLNYRFKIGIISALIVVFFLVLNLTPAGKEVRNFFYLISAPIQKSLWRLGERVSDFFETISEIKNLKKENRELKLKIQELLAENAKLKELKKENEILREALGIGLEKEFKLSLAEVIGKDISQDSLIINKGSEDGISKGLPVITQQKVLLGKISQVYKNFSKVMLISNKNSTFSARFQDSEPPAILPSAEGGRAPKDIEGIVKGKGNLQLFLDLIPQNAEIREGDDIVTISLGGIFPEGLLVGEIKEVKKSDIEPFQQAEISPFFDIKAIESLFIIISF